MELFLKRSYQAGGTNGELYYDHNKVCSTIELPWKNNRQKVSCVPEGRYRVVKRYSPKFGNHLWLQLVPKRSLILIHPANNAIKELEGCIAPVTNLSGAGKGSASKAALKKLMDVINKNGQHPEIFLTISS